MLLKLSLVRFALFLHSRLTRGVRPRLEGIQNFPQFIVIHTVKGFGIVNKAEIDVLLELSCFFDDPADNAS